jgi:hypothetical protein
MFFWKEFLGRIPHRPYCTDDLSSGLVVRPAETALKYRYIQINPPGFQWVLIFDLDYKTGALTAKDAGLPMPTWQTINRKNGHSHIAYALKAPVCTSDAARLAPLRYVAAIEAAYRQRLRADPLYTGLITKNPANFTAWDVYYMDDDTDTYDLDYLAGFVLEELRKPHKAKKEASEIAGLGRNCHIFETVRLWAYSAIRGYWDNPGDWGEAVMEHCQTVNSGFDAPLYHREVRGIARSIAGWTMKRFSPEKFSEVQRSSVMRRWEKESRKADGLNLLRAGLTVSDTAEACDVSLRAAQLWRKETEPERRTVTASKPWEELGISRRWYYRLLSDGKLEDYKRSRYKPLQS